MSKKRILIIEDDVLCSKVLKRKLETDDCQIDTANSESEAFQHLESNLYNLIISDVEIPDCNGFEIIESIKEDEEALNNLTPFIICSASQDFENMKKALDMGAEEYILKPFHLNLVSSIVDTALIKTAESSNNNMLTTK